MNHDMKPWRSCSAATITGPTISARSVWADTFAAMSLLCHSRSASMRIMRAMHGPMIMMQCRVSHDERLDKCQSLGSGNGLFNKNHLFVQLVRQGSEANESLAAGYNRCFALGQTNFFVLDNGVVG